MTTLEELTQAALAQIAAAKTSDEARQISSKFRSDGYDSLNAWHEGDDIEIEPARTIAGTFRDIFGRGDKPDEAMADAVNRVTAAAYAISRD